MLLRLAYLGMANTFALPRLLPKSVLTELHLIVRPDTVLKWHRNLIARRHAFRASAQLAPSTTARVPRGSRSVTVVTN